MARDSREGLWAAPLGTSEAVSKAGPRTSIHQRKPGTWDRRQTRAGPQDGLPTWEGVGLQKSLGQQGPSNPQPAPEALLRSDALRSRATAPTTPPCGLCPGSFIPA